MAMTSGLKEFETGFPEMGAGSPASASAPGPSPAAQAHLAVRGVKPACCPGALRQQLCVGRIIPLGGRPACPGLGYQPRGILLCLHSAAPDTDALFSGGWPVSSAGVARWAALLVRGQKLSATPDQFGCK